MWAALTPVRRVLLLTSLMGIFATLMTVLVVRSVVVRFQKRLEDLPGLRVSKTISIGTAHTEPQDSTTRLYARADHALLRARAAGRKRLGIG